MLQSIPTRAARRGAAEFRILLAAALAAAGLAHRAQAAANTANLTINAGQTVRVVDNRVFGLNTAEWNTYATAYGSTQVQGLFLATNTGALRFPGGSTADAYHWANGGSIEGSKVVAGVSVPDPNNITTNPSGTDFDQFAKFAQQVNAQPFITVNYGSGTAAEAAAWVQYSNVTKGYGFKYWEVGNECYGLWEIDGNTPPQDPVEYATRFAQYYTAMKAMDPTIKIGAVASPGEDDYPPSIEDAPVINPNETAPNNKHYGWTPEVLVTLKSLGVTPDFLIYHRYEQNSGGEIDAVLLQAASQGSLTSSPIYPWSYEIPRLRKQLTDYLPGTGANVEIDCTENNSVGTMPGKQSVSLVNGLYMADSIGSVLQTEVNADIWWDSFNGQETDGNLGTKTPLYGWRLYGDYGIMAAGGTPYPTYYIHKLLGRFAQGGDTVVNAASDNTLLSVYAAKRANGSLTLLVINKDPANTWQGNISISGYTATTTANAYSYGIPQDLAAQTTAGSAAADIQTTAMTGVSNAFSAQFAPYSATVIALTAPVPAITLSPLSENVNAGSTVVLTAGGINATSYQWTFNGATILSDSPSGTTTDIISGSSGPQLVITNPTAASAGTYTVVAVNSTGSSQPSLAATVTISSNATPGFLVNISSRAFVGTGANILIGGFYIGGSSSRTVLVQALGPALANEGVPGTIPHPVLKIYDSGGVVLYSNTGWGSSPVLLKAAASAYATPVLQSNSADSEVLLTLPPGGYTAEVSDANNATGVALCAIYQLP
jgi:hypothetical protein